MLLVFDSGDFSLRVCGSPFLVSCVQPFVCAV